MTEATENQIKEFHWRDGIHFRPNQDGSVEVFRRHKRAAYWTAEKGFHNPEETMFTIDPDSWDSIVSFTRPVRSSSTAEDVMSALYPILGGNHMGAEVWHEIGEAVSLAAAPSSGGFVVGNGGGDRWRAWDCTGPIWTEDRDKATRYHRREDAEAVHAEDEDVWRIEPYGEQTND